MGFLAEHHAPHSRGNMPRAYALRFPAVHPATPWGVSSWRASAPERESAACSRDQLPLLVYLGVYLHHLLVIQLNDDAPIG